MIWRRVVILIFFFRIDCEKYPKVREIQENCARALSDFRPRRNYVFFLFIKYTKYPLKYIAQILRSKLLIRATGISLNLFFDRIYQGLSIYLCDNFSWGLSFAICFELLAWLLQIYVCSNSFFFIIVILLRIHLRTKYKRREWKRYWNTKYAYKCMIWIVRHYYASYVSFFSKAS